MKRVLFILLILFLGFSNSIFADNTENAHKIEEFELQYLEFVSAVESNNWSHVSSLITSESKCGKGMETCIDNIKDCADEVLMWLRFGCVYEGSRASSDNSNLLFCSTDTSILSRSTGKIVFGIAPKISFKFDLSTDKMTVEHLSCGYY